MIMKYLFGIVVLFMFAGCGDNPVDPVPYNSVYFPLELGNRWNYSGSVDMRVEVSSIEPYGGKNYFAVVRHFPGASDTLLLRYERDDRLMIFFDGEELLYVDFSLPVGSTWDTYFYYTCTMRGKDLNSTVPAGIFDGVTEVLFENTLISDVDELNRYAPGVGLISIFSFRRNFVLESAFVNGINYP
jgi:hypothetical protein